MDKLEWRMGKPPVNYCATYSMGLVQNNTWVSLDSLGEKDFLERAKRKLPNFIIFLRIKVTGDRWIFLSDINQINNIEECQKLWDSRTDDMEFIGI
jgi:hypothetical protein